MLTLGLGGLPLKKGNLKSQEDVFYVRLHAQLIRSDPLQTYTSENSSFTRDILTLQSRVSNEGLSFLTKSLPKLGRALDQGLVSGRFNLPDGFKRAHPKTSIPAFLQAYFNRVFDCAGFLLDVVSVEAVKHLRQILYFSYKLEIPFSVTEQARVIDAFVQTDEELKISSGPLAEPLISLAKIITKKVFHGFDHKDILPRHGPGAVATGERQDAKWRFSRLYNAIHQVFPYYDYYVVGGARELTDRLDWYRSLQRHESGVAKVVLVPKDSRGPRLISCEPLEYQWIQQGLGRKLAHFLEYDSSYTRKRVNFTDQEINRRLAKTSSASQRFATLDLKDASDRVSLELVGRLFESCPSLARALEACRTTATLLPDGRTLPLNKFAPMGSALCFPVEAFVFWVVIVAAVIHGKNLPLQKVRRHVYVYGDDIVVPVEWAALSIQALEAVGLKVNIDKSCITGFFRESCGLDAFQGVEVTPLRLHTLWSNQPSDGSALSSYTAVANKLAARGYKFASDFVWKELDRVYGKIPYGTERASYPCKVVNTPELATHLNSETFPKRFNRNLQRLEFHLPKISPRFRIVKLDGWTRLLRNLLVPPVGDPSLAVLPLSVKVKRGWTSVT